MSRIDQINGLLRSELANLIAQEIPTNNYLITLCNVDCAPDLKSAKIYVSVIPENFEENALKVLKRHSSDFCKILRKKLKLRIIPKFNWIIDETEKKASVIDKILNEIKKDS
ncbi:MAG: ribosome-binding factor A [Candidatus Falkowbacteria bacterium]